MHAPEMGIVLIMAQIYKEYVFPENMLPIDLGNIIPMLKVFALIMGCFGVSKVREIYLWQTQTDCLGRH